MLRTFWGVAAIVVCSAPAGAQEFTPLLDGGRRDLLHEALSGEIAKDHVIEITRHHRIQASRGYRDAARYVLEQLRRYGFDERHASIESFASDGRLSYQTWQAPSGWHIESGELRMVEPRNERIVGYPEIAMSVITYSNAGDATAELVWVGAGTSHDDYRGKNVEGRFVLATGYGGDVHRLAVLEYGAVGVVAYLDDDRAKEYPDMLRYTGMWPRPEELERVTFGFNLTNRQGERLRTLLEGGERVVLHGRVSGVGLEPYEMDVVVAEIPGSDRAAEELVFSAHLDHPKESANDNASGSAAILDMARAMRQLIDEGRMPRPRRTVRFLWVPEWHGTMAYIDAHPEMVGPYLGGTYLANINMDMVGEHQEILHSRLLVVLAPASVPSALNDVVANMAEMVSRLEVRTPRGSLSSMNYRVAPYSGGSDHMMFIDRKIPGVMFSHTPDYTHHTSEDTPDKVDPVELERAEIIATAATLYLADLGDDEAPDLVRLVAANGLKRLADAERGARRRMLAAAAEPTRAAGPASPGGGADAWREAEGAVSHAAQWEHEALASVLWFHDAEETRAAVTAARERVGALADLLLESLRADARAAGLSPPAVGGPVDPRVPERLTRGPLDFDLPGSRLPAEAAAWYDAPDFPLGSAERFELVNFIDGDRTVSQIRDAVSAEFAPVALDAVARYLDDLVAIGVVRWRTP